MAFGGIMAGIRQKIGGPAPYRPGIAPKPNMGQQVAQQSRGFRGIVSKIKPKAPGMYHTS